MTTLVSRRRRPLFASIMAIVTILAIIMVASGVAHRSFATVGGQSDNSAKQSVVIHYYAHDDLKSLDFGSSVIEESKQSNLDTKNFIWHLDADGNPVGNFVDRMSVDPALTSAIATDITGRNSETWSTILGDRADEFKKVPVGARADTLHKAFLKDYKYWGEVLNNIKSFFKQGTVTVGELAEYTSSMYMLDNAIDGDKPSVVVRKSENSGGHFVWFNLKDQGVYGYRLECGYQPVDTEPYWPTPPDTPSVPDNPTPYVPVTPPTPTTTTTTTLKPKDPNAGPQAQTGGRNPNYGGGKNTRNDTKLTNEPSSPKQYVAPTAPTKAPTTTVKATTKSYSPKVSESSGQTTKVNNKTYDVVAGNADSKNYQPLDEVQKNPPSVEPALGNQTNSGAVSAPE